MNPFKQYFPFLLSIFLLFSLVACSKKQSEEPVASPDQQTQNTTDPSSTESNSSIDSIRLALPNGTSAQSICSLIPKQDFEIVISTSNETEQISALLFDGTVDLILLSPQEASSLYRSGKTIQIVAVVSPASSEQLDSMECLVGQQDYLTQHSEQIAQFLTAYGNVVAKNDAANGFLSTGWDMLDLVQENLEAQYLAQPDSNPFIPDGNFFYLPS